MNLIPMMPTDMESPCPRRPALLAAKRSGLVLGAVLLLWPGLGRVGADDHGHGHVHAPAPASAGRTRPPAASSDQLPAKLPRLPKGVTELKFGDMLVRPVGPRGLELTDKVLRLDGQRVRILGYMAHEETPVPGQFLLAPIPVQIHSHDNSLADDLPPGVVHVISPAHRGQPVPYTPQLLLLTGVLEVGNRAEPGGRVSLARLTLDSKVRPAIRRPSGEGATGGKGATALMKPFPTGH